MGGKKRIFINSFRKGLVAERRAVKDYLRGGLDLAVIQLREDGGTLKRHHSTSGAHVATSKSAGLPYFCQWSCAFSWDNPMTRHAPGQRLQAT